MGRRRGSSPYFSCGGGCDRKGGDRDKRLRFPPESTVYWPTPLLCHHPVSPPPSPPSLPSLSLPQAVEELSPHCPPPNRCTHKGECEGRGGDGFQKAPSMMAPGRFQCERERESQVLSLFLLLHLFLFPFHNQSPPPPPPPKRGRGREQRRVIVVSVRSRERPPLHFLPPDLNLALLFPFAFAFGRCCCARRRRV